MPTPVSTGFVIGNRGVGLDGVGLLLTLTIVARQKKFRDWEGRFGLV